MEMEIRTPEGVKNISLKNPKGKHTKKAFKLLTKILGAEKKDDIDVCALDAYTDYLEEMAAECTGLTVAYLDELDSDEKNKIIEYYQSKVTSKLDFLKSSLKSEGSQPRAI